MPRRWEARRDPAPSSSSPTASCLRAAAYTDPAGRWESKPWRSPVGLPLPVHCARRYSKQADLTSIDKLLASRTGWIESAPVSEPLECNRRGLKQLDLHERDAIVAAHVAGSSVAELARHYALSDYSIRMVLAKAGRITIHHHLTDGQLTTVSALYQSDVAVEAIARQFDMPSSSARLLLASLRLERPRTKSTGRGNMRRH